MEFCKSQFIVVYMKNKVFVYKLLSLMFKSLNFLFLMSWVLYIRICTKEEFGILQE